MNVLQTGGQRRRKEENMEENREEKDLRESEKVEKLLQKSADKIKMRLFSGVWKEIKPALGQKKRRFSVKRLTAAVALSLAGVLVCGFVFRFLYMEGVFDRALSYNYGQADYAKHRVAEAQYLPDPEKLASAEKSAVRAAGADFSVDLSEDDGGRVETTDESGAELSRIDLEGFRRCVDDWGTIEGMGAGKYQGYSIYEIRDELYDVLDAVPAFGRWFRFPHWSDYPEGEDPYYANWAYYMEYDEERDALTMTRVCWATRFAYFDFENKRVVEDYDEGGDESIVQFEVMRTRYYYDEAGRETVECYVYAVACDHVDNSPGSGGRTGYYQPDEKYYYPVSVQYLKNVRDTSLTKYIVEYCERESSDWMDSPEEWDFGDWGSSSPYNIGHRDSDGTRLDFLQLDYGGEDNVRMLKIRRRLPTEFIDFDAASVLFYAATAEGVGYMEGYYDRCTDASAPTAREALGGGGFDENGNVDEGFGGMGYSVGIYENVASGVDITRWEEEIYGNIGGIGILLDRSVSLLGERTGAGESFSQITEGFLARVDKSYLSGDRLAYAGVLDGYIADLAANIADNFCLKSEWADIYLASDRATEVDIDGNQSAASEAIEVGNAGAEVGVSGGVAHYTLSGTVPSTILLENREEYSLRLVFFSENGDWYLPAGSAPSAVFERGRDLTVAGEGEFSFADIDMDVSGTYTLGMALVKGNRVCSAFVPVRVTEYEDVTIPASEENGFEKSYTVTCEDGTLKVEFVCKDVQPPEVSWPEQVVVPRGTSVAEAFSGVRIEDNGEIVSAEIYRPDGSRYGRWNEEAEAGVNVLVVRDEGGNEPRFSLTVILV